MRASQNGRQTEFDFDAPRKGDGLAAWRKHRTEATQNLAAKLGLPLGHPSEVWIRGGIRLKGVLRVHEETLIVEDRRNLSLELVVDGVKFTPKEIEYCVRLDD